MTLDLKKIEMGMSNGADAVNSNFQAIQSGVNQPQIQTQSFKADNHSQWASETGRITKQGRIVTIQFRGTNANNTIGTTITTLPSWAKPMETVYGSGFETDGNYQGNETLEVIGKRVERIMSTLKVDEFESNKPKTISEQLMFSKIAQIEETKPADLYKEPNKYCDFNHYKEYDEKLIYRPLGNTLAGHRDFNISIDDIERYSQADAYSKCSKPSEGEEDGNN